MKPRILIIPCILIFALFACAPCSAGEPEPAAEPKKKDLAAEVFEMTGARTKIVWEHQIATSPMTNWDGTSPDYELVCFDTAEGKQRVVLPGPGSFVNPSITLDGERIIFTDGPSGKVYIVDWDGKNKTQVASGFGLSTWVDPKTGTQWFFVTTDGKVFRHQVYDPEIKELVWDQTHVSLRFTVSADGTHAGAELPWPRCGVAILPNVLSRQYGRGCNAYLAPDNSYRFMHMGETGGHRGVMMYDDGGVNRRRILFNNVPGRENEASWAPRWTTDVRFLTLSCPIGGAYQEIFIGEFDDDFTRVVRWIQISDELGQDIKGHAWIAPPGLGYSSGEAPLTVEFPAPEREGEWEWDYGTGDKEKAPAGKHTYAKGGRYRVTARQGKTEVEGSVHVYRAKPPTVTATDLKDETRMVVAFDEPVQLKDTKISLASGIPVKGWSLDTGGIDLVVELGGRITGDDTLHIEGVYDRSQVPKALVENDVLVSRPPWPADRSGLVFLWETQEKSNFQRDAGRDAFSATRVTTWRRGTYSRTGAMSLQGGVLFALDAGMGVYSGCTKAQQLTVEAVVTPANLYQGWKEHPHWIMACASGRSMSDVNFLLGQEGRKLVFCLKQNPAPDDDEAEPSVKRVELCELPEGRPTHVVISYEPGRFACYVNGKQVVQTDEVTGSLEWRPLPFDTGLSFGGGKNWGGIGHPPWRGELEGIAIYSRAVDAEEAAKNFAAYDAMIKARPVVRRVELRGRLVEKSTVPDLGQIAPYRDALVVYEYEVEKVLEAALVGGTEESHLKRISELREKAKTFPVGPEADVGDEIGKEELQVDVSVRAENGKNAYTVKLLPGEKLSAWADVQAKINGGKHEWDQLLKGVNFDPLPDVMKISVEGTTPQGRRLTARFEIRPEQADSGPADKADPE